MKLGYAALLLLWLGCQPPVVVRHYPLLLPDDLTQEKYPNHGFSFLAMSMLQMQSGKKMDALT